MTAPTLSTGRERRVRQTREGSVQESHERRSGKDRRVARCRWIAETIRDHAVGRPDEPNIETDVRDLILALRREPGAAEAVAWAEALCAYFEGQPHLAKEAIARVDETRAAYLAARGRKG